MVVFDFRRLCAGVTHPRPLSRGEVLDGAFFLVMSGLWCEISPSQRGDEGVCHGEKRGLGRGDFCCCLERRYFLCLV